MITTDAVIPCHTIGTIFFQKLIDEILIKLQTDVGPLPGRYTMKRYQSIFNIDIYQRLKQLLSSYGLEERSYGPGSNCSNSEICQSRLIKYISFLRKMKMLYPMVVTNQTYLAQRPGNFFYLFLICVDSNPLHQVLPPPPNTPTKLILNPQLESCQLQLSFARNELVVHS